jgi:hypothetical protein
MSFLIGKTQSYSPTTPEAAGSIDDLLKTLRGIGPQAGLFPSTNSKDFNLQPYLDLFTQQNARNLAQAKESAGNLTGSGLGSIIGQEAGRASTEQGAFLANLMEQRRTEDANRYLAALTGGAGSPAAAVQHTYQPGLLDYLFQGAASAAPFAPYIFPKAVTPSGGH